MPTKSAIAGMCCAALGYDRGGDAEQRFLKSFDKLSMTALAIPRKRCMNELAIRRLTDYHTVQNTKTAEGKTKDCHITHRSYLLDASFGVLLEGDPSLLTTLAQAWADPVLGYLAGA
jgi:CRISPR system Cascade subunit CasD